MIINFQSVEGIKKTIETAPLVVALFSDLGCNVCLAITPELEALSEAYPDVSVISADVETIKALVGDYLVFVYPTIIVFAEGKETRRFERVFSMGDIEATVERLNGLLFG